MHGNVAEFATNPYIRENLATTYTYPAGPNTIEASMRAVYVPKEGHDWSDNHYLNVAEGTIELSGDSDSDVVLELAHIPACRDEVDNTFTGRIDDEEAGCTDINKDQYDPSDDVELVQGWSRTTYSIASDGVRFISGAEGEREHVRINSYVSAMAPSIQAAMEIAVKTEIKADKDQIGQAFALKYAVGKNDESLNSVNFTEIYNADGQDGWGMAEFTEITRDFFENGLEFEVTAVHATKVRGEPATDGNDRLVFAEGTEISRIFNTQWVYQPEDVPGGEREQKARVSINNDVNPIDILDINNWQTELERKMKK
jgi:hypothetical protein